MEHANILRVNPSFCNREATPGGPHAPDGRRVRPARLRTAVAPTCVRCRRRGVRPRLPAHAPRPFLEPYRGAARPAAGAAGRRWGRPVRCRPGDRLCCDRLTTVGCLVGLGALYRELPWWLKW